MGAAPFDEQQRPGPESIPTLVNDRSSRAGEHVEPLISPTMPVIRPALSVAWREHHGSSLSPSVPQGDPESLAESKLRSCHQRDLSHTGSAITPAEQS
jgi:hypothetical protein